MSKLPQDHAAQKVLKNAEEALESFTLIPASTYDFLAKRYKNGKTFFTGIGKSSFLAMKQVTTLKSIQYDAEYLHAVDALHGDLGAIPDDNTTTIIAISKSGLSLELFDLFKAILVFRPKVQIVMICMSNDKQLEQVKSRLNEIHAKAIQFTNGFTPLPMIVQLPCSNVAEIDGYGIIPSISNALFELFIGMSIAPLTFESKDALERIKQAHPGGALQSKVTNLLATFENAKQ